MKRRILNAFLIIISVAMLCLGLTACKPPHRFADEWSYDSEKHWKDCECIHEVEPITGEHELVNHVCTVCGYYEISDWLNYREVTLNYAGTSIQAYEVTGFNRYGTAPEYVGIPSVYNGKPVVGIGSGAFQNCYQLKDVIFSKNTTYIGGNAFYLCTSLEKLDLPFGLDSIGDGAFSCCENLKNFTLPSTLSHIGERAFYICRSIENITIPNSVKSIGQSAFEGCTSLKNLQIGYGVELLEGYVFSACGIESISIPKNVTHIKDFAFSDCSNLQDVSILNENAVVDTFAFYGCNLPDTDNSTIYEGVAQTPDISDAKVIIDWSKETNLDVSSQHRVDNLGCVREGNIDIKETVEEVTFIGNPDKVYRNLTVNICSRTADSPLTVKFFNFKFTTGTNYAIKPWNSEDFELTVINSGTSSIGTTYSGGHIFGYSAADGRFAGTINFTGSGTLSLTAGSGSTGGDGGTAIFANYITVSGVTLNAYGGKGGTGKTGENGSNNAFWSASSGGTGGTGGNGGHAIILTGEIDATLANNENLNAVGGKGGTGGTGGKGGDNNGWFSTGAGGGNGGQGGNGGAGILDSSGLITKTSGGSGLGGNGGQGGSGNSHDGARGDYGMNGKSADARYTRWSEN